MINQKDVEKIVFINKDDLEKKIDIEKIGKQNIIYGNTLSPDGLSSLKQLLIPLRLEKYGMSCNEALSSYGIINGMTMPVLMFPEVVINSFSGLLVPEFTYYYTKKDMNAIKYIISKRPE